LNFWGRSKDYELWRLSEAARAGDAGRGFAVVASEVKAPAEQTSKTNGDIGRHIPGIQAATQESANAIKEIGETIERTFRDFLDHRRRRRGTGRGNAVHCRQCAAGSGGHPAGGSH